MTDERTVVISTHQVHDVEQLLDHVIILGSTETESVLLNAPLDAIADHYVFEQRPVGTDTSDALWVEPSIHGVSVMAPRPNGQEATAVSLELLFKAALNHSQAFAPPLRTPSAIPLKEEDEREAAEEITSTKATQIQSTSPLDGEREAKLTGAKGTSLPLFHWIFAHNYKWMWGVLAIVIGFCWFVFVQSDVFMPLEEYANLRFADPGDLNMKTEYRFQVLAMNIWDAVSISFLVFAGAAVYAGLGSRKVRITWLMLPTSNLQKTLMRVVCVIVLGVLPIVVGVALSDALRIAVSSFTNPEMAHPLWSNFGLADASMFGVNNTYTILRVAFWLFLFAFAMLISALFRSWAWAWTIIGIIAYRLCVGIVGSVVMPLFGIDTEVEFDPYFYGFCALMTPVWIWLAHRIFCRWQLDGWRFTNL